MGWFSGDDDRSVHYSNKAPDDFAGIQAGVVDGGITINNDDDDDDGPEVWVGGQRVR